MMAWEQILLYKSNSSPNFYRAYFQVLQLQPKFNAQIQVVQYQKIGVSIKQTTTPTPTPTPTHTHTGMLPKQNQL